MREIRTKFLSHLVKNKQEATSDDIAHVGILLTPNMETPDVTIVPAP